MQVSWTWPLRPCFISCTAILAVQAAETLEAEFLVPVVTSNQALILAFAADSVHRFCRSGVRATLQLSMD